MTVPEARAEARRLIATLLDTVKNDNGPLVEFLGRVREEVHGRVVALVQRSQCLVPDPHDSL